VWPTWTGPGPWAPESGVKVAVSPGTAPPVQASWAIKLSAGNCCGPGPAAWLDEVLPVSANSGMTATRQRSRRCRMGPSVREGFHNPRATKAYAPNGGLRRGLSEDGAPQSTGAGRTFGVPYRHF